MESMLEHAATSATVPNEAEAYQTLLARAHRKTGAVAAELVVRHILSVTGDADWPVRREALEALLRRIAFGKADAGSRSSPGRPRAGSSASTRRGARARPRAPIEPSSVGSSRSKAAAIVLTFSGARSACVSTCWLC